MTDYQLSPSKVSDILYASSVHDVAKGALNSQPDIIDSDEREWIGTPRNYDLIYESGDYENSEELVRNFRASSLMHDTANELISQGYRNGIANNPEGLKLIIDRVLEAEHPTNNYLNMKSRELQDSHDLEPEDVKELQPWGRKLSGVRDDLSENLPYIKARLDGDSMTPETESFNAENVTGTYYRTMADLKFHGDDRSEIAETKIKWSQDPDIPLDEDIFQARLTARIHDSEKAYLVYGGQGEVYEYAPLADYEMELVEQKLEPLLEETEKTAGWNKEVQELEPEVVDLIRSELDETFREYYRSEIIGEDYGFDHNQASLEAY